MRSLLRNGLALSVVLVAGLALAEQPKTPLGKWMQQKVGTVVSQGDSMGPDDWAGLEKSFQCVAKHPPSGDKYAKWTQLATQAATAAHNHVLKAKNPGDPPGVKDTCKQCHDASKQAYIADHLQDAWPPADCN